MKKVLIGLSLLSMVLGFTAFECASAELTGAKMYLNQKQYAKAKETLLKEVEKNPKSDEGWFLLGGVYSEEGNVIEMLKAFDKSLEVSKKYEPQITDYKKYTWQTSFNKGVGFFNSAVKTTNPDSMKMFFANAIQQFNNSIACEPDSTIGYENVAASYLNMGKTDESVPVLEKLVSLGRPAFAFSRLGQIFILKGANLMDSYYTSKNAADSVKAFEWYSKAINVLEKGREKFPTDAEILLQLGNAYYSSEKLDVATESFKTLSERSPTNRELKYAYGVVLLKSKKYDEATKVLEEVVKMDPNNLDANYNLAATYISWGNDLREVAIKKESNDKSYLDKFKATIPYLQKYLEIKPGEGKVWTSLAQVYANLGMKKEAEEAFKKAEQYK
ncbi:MAG: tetratricopeptide repeat protein [Ignavibacteriales bacterium]|nr:tetratricopeptide repeat protein [Ignavibacteriales bacterium]